MSAALLFALAVATPSLAADGAERVYTYQPGTPGTLLEQCRQAYFPMAEVRALTDMPIGVMIARDNHGGVQVGPATGLDLFAVWVSPVRPRCDALSESQAKAGFSGVSLHFPFVANASYAVFPTLGGGDSEADASADVGAFLSGGAGVLLDARWDAGSHGNQVQLGVLARGGYFVGSTNKWMWTVGPALNIRVL